MKIIIIGCGKVGFSLAKQLSAENHDVTLIDSNPKVIERAQEMLDVIVVAGNGAALDIQHEAGVDEAQLLIAMTPSDEVNLLCCIVAKKLGCPNTIARVRNSDYVDQIGLMRDDFGISMTVNPEFAAARSVYRTLRFPSFLKIDSFAKGRVEIVELKISEGGPLDGITLIRLAAEFDLKVLVCAVERDGQITIPDGNFMLKAGDKINVTASRADLFKMVKKLGIEANRVRNVMIIGGGRIASYLSEELISSGIDVKIIEKDHDRCIELASHLPKALIINDDGTNHDVLIAEGIAEADAVVTLTGIDEQNLVISLYAEHIGVQKTVTKVNRTEYGELFADKDIGSTFSTKNVIASDIIRYVRSLCTADGEMLTLHKIIDGKAEAIEFFATDKTRGLGVALKDLKKKKNILIACIIRGNRIIIPRGGDMILSGDTVIVVTGANEPIYTLNDIFEGDD